MSDLTPNNDPFLQNPYPDDEIDLKELFSVLWSGKWLISAVTSLAAAISVVVALSLPNIYSASALLAPAESSGGGLSGLMKQYGGLASLAGVSLPGGEEGSRAQLGMQLMRSRAFIGDFVERRDILPELMAVESWDAGSGQIVFDPESYDAASETWVRDVEPPKAPAPSAQEAHKAFSSILGVSQDKQTGYVSVSIEHQSPVVAAQWVNWLVEDVNAAVKAQDVSEAEKSIEYLKQQVANTSLADLQAMFFELIQSQTETVMLAEVRPEYVFKTIDPAVVPEEKSKPSRALICVLGTLLGGMLGVVIVLIRHYARSEPEA
jgi:uncharacterized protein involved in exopolysaccharide biosynthesis